MVLPVDNMKENKNKIKDNYLSIIKTGQKLATEKLARKTGPKKALRTFLAIFWPFVFHLLTVHINGRRNTKL